VALRWWARTPVQRSGPAPLLRREAAPFSGSFGEEGHASVVPGWDELKADDGLFEL
jgi:hypothetical protein